MFYIASLSWACTTLGKNGYLLLSQCLGQAHGQGRTEESQAKVCNSGSKQGEIETCREEGPPSSVSSQHIGKVFSFTLYCFCCLPSLTFFPPEFKKEKNGVFSLLYWGYIFNCKNI